MIRLVKFIFVGLLLFLINPVTATELQKIDYKNIKDGSKLGVENGIWTLKPEKNSNFFVKRTSEGYTRFSEFYSPDGKFLFSTGTQYEFIYKGMLIGYSNTDLKFYEFFLQDDILEQRELSEDEVGVIFPKYTIIKTMNFSETNSYKLKKKRGDLKIILLNNTDRIYNNYSFSTNNSRIELYPLKGFVDVKKRGMVQFSRFGDNTRTSPWYIILVR